MPAKKTTTSGTSALRIEPRTTLPGSTRRALSAAGPTSETPPPKGRLITVSVIVRRQQAIHAAAIADTRLTRAQFRAQYGADPAALKAVRAFAQQYGLTATSTADQLAARTVQLTGTRAQLAQAFGVVFSDRQHGDHIYRVREGDISIPAALDGLVEAVLGLDNRPQAKAHFRIARQPPAQNPEPGAASAIPAANAPTSFSPPQIAQLYQFPQGASAAGQTIGLIELGGGYRMADLKAYFNALNLPAPAIAAVRVDGGKNAPSNADSADGEVMLDIEVAAAVAPGAKIVVYFAPNTDQGFIDAIAAAVHDTTHQPSVISISWGGPEAAWTAQAVAALDSAGQAAALLGVTITVAAGDDGAADGMNDGASHVDFPASSPHVLACGGTRVTAAGATLANEVVWNELSANAGATGGGVSSLFAKPAWQAGANVPASANAAGGRGVPDVAGHADPQSGYVVRVDGQTVAVGGTSAVAPLWAGLLALANAQNKTTAGFVNPTLYGSGAQAALRDITQGNNGGFAASKGWDACTGLGSPIGTAVISTLASPTADTGHGTKPPKPKKPTQPDAGRK